MRVIKTKFDYDYIIVNDNQVEEVNYCDCHDEYGNTIGCYEAACHSEENDNCDWKHGDEETHTTVTAITYWDGHNWQSVVLEADWDLDVELLPEDDEEAIEILSAFEEATFPEYNCGFSCARVGEIKFIKSIWQGAYEVATCRKI